MGLGLTRKGTNVGAFFFEDAIPSSARIRGHLLPMGEGKQCSYSNPPVARNFSSQWMS